MIAETIIFGFILYLLYILFARKPDGLPPGEWGWPFIGHLPSMKVSTHKYIEDFSKKHGKTFTWRIGTRTMIFVCDFKTIKKIFNEPHVADRPKAISLDIYAEFKKLGISNGNGLAWQNLRRFSIRHMRDLGMGKSTLEDDIRAELDDVIKDFGNYLNEPTTMPYSLNIAILNIIWKIVADFRYDLKDPEIERMERLLTQIFLDAQCTPMLFFDCFHYLERILPHWIKQKAGLQGSYDRAKEFREFLQKSIDSHKKTLDRNDPRDFIDEFLIALEENEDKPSEATNTFSEKELLYTMSDFFAAGSESVSSTIRWVLIFLSKNPEVQKKVQEEIDSVVPKDRRPELNDRDKLIYTEATIQEAMRMKTIAPLSLYHSTAQDTVIDNYKIPKDTIVVSCIQYCHFDPDYWKNPDEFKPERFILENGKVNTYKDGFIPFSIGKRICPGESLARMEVFLFCSALIQRFNFETPADSQEPSSHDASMPMFNIPTAFKVIITDRK